MVSTRWMRVVGGGDKREGGYMMLEVPRSVSRRLREASPSNNVIVITTRRLQYRSCYLRLRDDIE